MAQSSTVKNQQLKELGKFLRANGVSQKNLDDFLKDQNKVIDFYAQLKGDSDGWFEKLQVTANAMGARVHLITKLVVDYKQSHNDAAMAGGPQTPSNYNVLKVADKYQPSENKEITETIILLNWPKGGGSYQKAVEWGLQNGLRKTTPHVPFAIGKQFPKLNYDLGPNPMYVVETTGCAFVGNARACNVWWSGASRGSSLFWQSSFGDGVDWFAFRK